MLFVIKVSFMFRKNKIKNSFSDLRLIALFFSKTPCSGQGNFYIGGYPVCDDRWDIENARVVCRMLG